MSGILYTEQVVILWSEKHEWGSERNLNKVERVRLVGKFNKWENNALYAHPIWKILNLVKKSKINNWVGLIRALKNLCWGNGYIGPRGTFLLQSRFCSWIICLRKQFPRAILTKRCYKKCSKFSCKRTLKLMCYFVAFLY